jgi:hypothetical protein
VATVNVLTAGTLFSTSLRAFLAACEHNAGRGEETSRDCVRINKRIGDQSNTDISKRDMMRKEYKTELERNDKRGARHFCN